MDATKFDAVARRLASGLSRREALRGLAAGAIAALGGGAALRSAAAQDGDLARQRCLRNDDLCNRTRQCCQDKGKRLCRQVQDASNSDTFCCSPEGEECAGRKGDGSLAYPRCCLGLKCSSNNRQPGKCRKA